MDLKEKQFFPHKMSKNNYNFPVQLGYLNWNLSKSTLIGTSTWYIYVLRENGGKVKWKWQLYLKIQCNAY